MLPKQCDSSCLLYERNNIHILLLCKLDTFRSKGIIPKARTVNNWIQAMFLLLSLIHTQITSEFQLSSLKLKVYISRIPSYNIIVNSHCQQRTIKRMFCPANDHRRNTSDLSSKDVITCSWCSSLFPPTFPPKHG